VTVDPAGSDIRESSADRPPNNFSVITDSSTLPVGRGCTNWAGSSTSMVVRDSVPQQRYVTDHLDVGSHGLHGGVRVAGSDRIGDLAMPVQ
jgi:hypothetical protein